jgi:hypothetical protein
VGTDLERSSLLYYIGSGKAGFCLKPSLTLAGGGDDKLYPFSVIDESEPLSCLLEANLLTDANSHIGRKFLLMQKSEYNLQTDELKPINNKDIEQYWQEAFSFYSQHENKTNISILSEQVAKDGSLKPFQSLFYCKHKKSYFHPPCPKCSLPLEQCYDDDLLAQQGLQPYSTSLKRYLFCPSCFEILGSSSFYVSSLQTNDPETTIDQWGLIKEFGSLKENHSMQSELPCLKCSKSKECFGPENLAASNMVPFSFYPFFMFVLDEYSVNAPDFLALISGATINDLEDKLGLKQAKGRINCLKHLKQNCREPLHFFNEDDQRRFLEILYLKLAFLEDAFDNILHSLNEPGYPDYELSLDRIWVRLPDQAGMLPFFWNFKAKHIAAVGYKSKMPFFRQKMASSNLYYLGIIWFYTLLVNRKQDISKVYQAINQAVGKDGVIDDASVAKLLNCETNNTFAMENIFWIPDSVKVKDRWRSIWETSINLGWYFLKSGIDPDFKWSEEKFKGKLEALRGQIKEDLFSIKEDSAPTGQDSDESFDVGGNDRKIHDILLKVLPRLSSSSESLKEMPEDITMETVVLKSDEAGEDETPVSTDLSIRDVDESDNMDATVIREKEPAKEPDADDLLDATMVRPSSGSDDIINRTLSQGLAPEAQPVTPSKEPDADDLLDATMVRPSPGSDDIINRTLSQGSAPKAQPVIPSKEPDEDENLDATMVIRPSQKAGFEEGRGAPKPSSREPEKKSLLADDNNNGDALDETFVIKPGNKK